MEKIFINKDNCFEHTGYRPDELARYTGIEAYTRDYVFDIVGTNTAPLVIIDSSDGRVHMSRTYMLEVNEVENDRFEVKGTMEGMGRKIFSEQIRELKNTDFLKISCVALKSEGFNGHYTWARFGYIIDEDEVEDVADHIATMQYNCAESKPHRIVIDPNHREWWRNNGISWTGTFDLTDGSESLTVFNNYLKEKGLKR